MMLTSGCVTNLASHYGKKVGYFVPTGPAHGDTTQIYVQGKLDIYTAMVWYESGTWGRSPLESRPAHMRITLRPAWNLASQEIHLVSREVHEGELPKTAFEYPEIKLSTPPKNKSYEKIFIESGQDIGTSDWKCLYVKKENNPQKPTAISLTGATKEYPRSKKDDVIHNFILFPCAVIVDAAASPVYATGIILFLVLASTGVIHIQ